MRGALGDVREVFGVALERVLVGELAALVQAHAQAVRVELALGVGALGGELVDAQARVGGALDVRRAGDVEDVF